MKHDYQMYLYYGTFEDGYAGPSYSFEAADQEVATDDTISARLAENLDTTVNDIHFDWNFQSVRLPDTLVQRIKADAIKEYQALCRS